MPGHPVDREHQVRVLAESGSVEVDRDVAHHQAGARRVGRDHAVLGGRTATAERAVVVPVLPLTLTGTRRMLGASRWWPQCATLALQVGRPIAPPQCLALFAAAVQMRQAAEAVIARGLVADAR